MALPDDIRTERSLLASRILEAHWGYPSFRPGQLDIILSVLAGHDTLAILPTGGGKSICFQVPALCQEGVCLVISPLIALMKDQVEHLRKKNITAYAIVSGMSRKEVRTILEVAGESNCKFLYVSPERLSTSLFNEYLPGLGINLIAVDEAHCISQWGYDFRPTYLKVAAIREELPQVPVIALTASATPTVQQDIQEKLLMKHPRVFRESFRRPALSYRVWGAEDKINPITALLEKHPGSALVYCKSRRRASELSSLLTMRGMAASYYHAGLEAGERTARQQDWIANKTRVMVCTNAFGMGIDKPDVRLVIHADPPDCLENYYQEAGRAGRDGAPAEAVLLYQEKDLHDLQQQPAARFPDLRDIRHVYQCIMNFLQLPAWSGEGQQFDFAINDFLQKFPMPVSLAMAAIKTLEQEGWLSLQEWGGRASSVQFTANKESLALLEKDHPDLEPLLKALLRTYAGIWDDARYINELQLAHLLKADKQKIIDTLKRLHAFQVIHYVQQTGAPQILFLRDRVPTQDFQVNPYAYSQRKKAFSDRINAMVHYIGNRDECRSKLISAYFGETGTPPCGICDHCRKKSLQALNSAVFNPIHAKIKTALLGHTMEIEALASLCADIDTEQFWLVLQYLQKEAILRTDHAGKIYYADKTG